MKIFTQTRIQDNTPIEKKSFAEVILNPSAPLGGLYTFERLPQIDFSSLLALDYQALVKKIFSELGISLDENILDEALKTYESFDDPSNPAPLVKIKPNLYAQELYHGSSRAFKDMALQPFGVIFSKLAHKINQKYLILAATSGDTGPATLQSFANKENIFVSCLYPKGGTSDVQELQMITQDAKNLKILPINGDFDDAQSTLKALLKDEDFKAQLEKKGILLSAANSVNFGRIAFQIIYHIWGYLHLVKSSAIKLGDKINLVIPSGNFGNALGAFYAKLMGLNIEKIIIASNENNILSEFIQTGIYDLTNKSLIKTHSPAMDILKSSNVERVLYTLFGGKRTYELMDSLEKTSSYRLSPKELEALKEHFLATFCDDKACLEAIKDSFTEGYLLDPHTAIAKNAAEKFHNNIPTIICSTAQWCKFAPTIVQAIFNQTLSDKDAIDLMCDKLNIKAPEFINDLFSKPLIHQEVYDKKDIQSQILKWLPS